MKTPKYLSILSLAVLGALYGASPAWATPLLGSDLASFAVLGATPSVTNTGATSLTGDVGVSPAASITGQSTLTVNGINALLNPGDVHLNDATASLAQGQLTNAITNLGLMGAGITLGNPDLSGLTLTPNVYTVHAGVSNLTTLLGALTLDGLGNANAVWVFQMDSSLITSPGSVVNVINTGSGAGVFWDVRSSATLDTTTSFQGNILALTSIVLNTGATIGCGRALANTGNVTMDTNTIGTGCTTDLGGSTTLLAGSNGLSGGLTVPVGGGIPIALPFAPIPEPATLTLLGLGLAGLGFSRRRHG